MVQCRAIVFQFGESWVEMFIASGRQWKKKGEEKIPQVFPVLSARVGGRRMFASSRIHYQKSHETEYVEKKLAKKL